MDILDKLLALSPDVDQLIPENHTYYNLAKLLQDNIKQGKR
jgi:hypothetical protein